MRQRREVKPLNLLPGQRLVIHVSDEADDIESFVGQPVTECLIRRGTFILGNGIHWKVGDFYAPDPERPGKSKRLDGDYRPGGRYSDWPSK